MTDVRSALSPIPTKHLLSKQQCSDDNSTCSFEIRESEYYRWKPLRNRTQRVARSSLLVSSVAPRSQFRNSSRIFPSDEATGRVRGSSLSLIKRGDKLIPRLGFHRETSRTSSVDTRILGSRPRNPNARIAQSVAAARSSVPEASGVRIPVNSAVGPFRRRPYFSAGFAFCLGTCGLAGKYRIDSGIIHRVTFTPAPCCATVNRANGRDSSSAYRSLTSTD